MNIQIWMVNLVNVSREDDLCAFTRPCDNRLHLVWCEVLRLVDDEENLDKTPTPDIGQGFNDQLLILQVLADPAKLRVSFHELVLDHAEIVIERLHVRIQLGVDITGEDLKEMGCSSGPRIGRILKEILICKIDGGLSTRNAELAMARKLISQ